MKKEIKTYKVADLELNSGQLGWLPRNPRQWTRQDIDQMAASIKEDPDFIQDRPPLVVPLPGKKGKAVVFAHNLWTSAAKDGKLVDEVSCYVYTPENDADRQTIVRRALKDNGTFGSWDWDILANEWPTEQATAWGVPAWDADQGEGEVEPIAATEDDFDEEQDEIHVRCAKGDIWQLGDHRLMCGDSIDLEQVKKLMGGAEANMIFTDPPYGVSYTEKNDFLNRSDNAQRLTNPIENDSKTAAEMHDFWLKAFTNMAECCASKMTYYIASPQGGDLLLLLLLQAIDESPLMLKHTLVWNKNNHVLGRCDYNYKHEQILYGWLKKGTHTFYGKGEFKTTVWDIDKPLRNDLHPTMKPLRLVENCILDGSKEGDAVLDVFGGSGTTLIAAEQLGRRCYMMELDPHYCDVIIARWEKLTGKQAKRIN